MINFSFILFLFICFTFVVKANDIKIIDLHKNKSLDQLVLDVENKEEDVLLEENTNDLFTEENISTNEQDQSELLDDISDNESLTNNQIVTLLKSETILDLNESIINNHLESINNIKSKTIYREFIKILSSQEIGDKKDNINNIYFIIKKLYEIGEIGKAYDLLKSIDIKKISNQEYLKYFNLIELNYLFSTYQLSDSCDLNASLIKKSLVLDKFLLEKTDIFCLTLENKISEAKLQNSLLLDTEKETDLNFQKLFNYMILNDKNNHNFETLDKIKSKELIFLYSAMLRINELPLTNDFIEIDPHNLSIPVILSSSTEMDIRIKAANNAFYDESLSIESLSALYQSVDFNSKDFNQPEQTILSLNNNKELIMAFYYQLANIQIFSDQRLNVIIDYWKFAKKFGLERIAYGITKNIIDTFTPTVENSEFAMDIALAHISNKDYEKSIKWINLFANSNIDNERIEYAKFLISLNETNDLDVIIQYISNNYKNLTNLNDQKTHETLKVLISFLNLEDISQDITSYDFIVDDRQMPSYFLINDIKNNIENENNLSLFILSVISLNNNYWTQLHPEHLYLILSAYSSYDQGLLIKPIILEILNELEIVNE